MGNNNDEICTKVIAVINEQLEKGEIPWQRPWSTESPVNAVSKKGYRGTNFFVLGLTAMAKGYADNRWLTSNQANALSKDVKRGGVSKGEKGTPILFWHFPDRDKDEKDPENEAVYRPCWARLSYVWNVEQCTGVLKSDGGTLAPYDDTRRAKEPLEEAQKIHDLYAKSGGPLVKTDCDMACYVPSRDLVLLPPILSFNNAAEFHGVRFHEEIHSTGAKHRLKRSLAEVAPYGSEDYGIEELTAELGSAMLRGITGIHVNYSNSAAYILNWSEVLSDKPRMFAQAAGRAQAAVDYIMGNRREEQTNNGKLHISNKNCQCCRWNNRIGQGIR